jgi:superfamily II DNA or RNA helicase
MQGATQPRRERCALAYHTQVQVAGRYKPMAHQIETAAFLTMHRRAFVFSEPGTGKTLSALWAADYLMQAR